MVLSREVVPPTPRPSLSGKPLFNIKIQILNFKTMILAQVNIADAAALQAAIANLQGVTLTMTTAQVADIAGEASGPTAVKINGAEVIVEAIVTGSTPATKLNKYGEREEDRSAVQNAVVLGPIKTTDGLFTKVRNTFKSKPGEYPAGSKVKVRLMELRTVATEAQLANPDGLKMVELPVTKNGNTVMTKFVLSNYWQVVK